MLDEANGLFDGSDDGTFVPFTDILFNVVMGFSFMIFIAFALIKPEARTAVELKADMVVTMSWPDNSPDDIDTYVEDPAGNVVWYHSKEAGFLHLDRDDRGMFRDTMVVNGQRVENPLNQESVTVRGLIPGEYVVNVYHYIANSTEPVPVSVRVEKLNPKLQVVYYGTVYLDHRGQELTVVRFTVDADGNVSNVNDRPKKLSRSTRKAPTR
jgi:hypothetical protein